MRSTFLNLHAFGGQMVYVGVLDESNRAAGEFVRFFATAVLACPGPSLGPLTLDVRTIRERYGFRTEDQFKWDTNAQTGGVSPEDHAAAKGEVLKLLGKHKLTFLPVLTHHLVSKAEPNRLVTYGANMALLLFDRFLQAHDEDGVCFLDRRPTGGDPAKYLREVFGRNDVFSLKRTHTLGYTMVGASHLLSVVDISLGAFCFAINWRDEKRVELTSELLKTVVGAMWSYRLPDGRTALHPDGSGYAFLPMKMKTPPVQTAYDELILHWNRLVAK